MQYLTDLLESITGDNVSPSELSVIVPDFDFNREQRAQLQQVSVTSNIPFCLGAGAISRPKGAEEHINLIKKEDVVNISKKTFSFNVVNAREAKLSFLYTCRRDATVAITPSDGDQTFDIPAGERTLFDERVVLGSSKEHLYKFRFALKPHPLGSTASLGEAEVISRCLTVDMHETVAMQEEVEVDGLTFVVRNLFGSEENDGEKGSSDENTCVICLESSADVAILSCRHQCLCGECAASLLRRGSKCPICRNPCELFVHMVSEESGNAG